MQYGNEQIARFGKRFAEQVTRKRTGNGIQLVKIYAAARIQKIRTYDPPKAERFVQQFRIPFYRLRSLFGKFGRTAGIARIARAFVLFGKGKNAFGGKHLFAFGSNRFPPQRICGAVDITLIFEIRFHKRARIQTERRIERDF